MEGCKKKPTRVTTSHKSFSDPQVGEDVQGIEIQGGGILQGGQATGLKGSALPQGSVQDTTSASSALSELVVGSQNLKNLSRAGAKQPSMPDQDHQDKIGPHLASPCARLHPAIDATSTGAAEVGDKQPDPAVQVEPDEQDIELATTGNGLPPNLDNESEELNSEEHHFSDLPNTPKATTKTSAKQNEKGRHN